MSSLNSPSTLNRLSSNVHPTWRVVVAMLLVQAPAALIALTWSPIGNKFLDLWYCCAFAMPLGFVAGLLWQKHVAPGVLGRHRWMLLGYGLFSLMLPIFGILTYDLWKLVPDAL